MMWLTLQNKITQAGLQGVRQGDVRRLWQWPWTKLEWGSWWKVVISWICFEIELVRLLEGRHVGYKRRRNLGRLVSFRPKPLGNHWNYFLKWGGYWGRAALSRRIEFSFSHVKCEMPFRFVYMEMLMKQLDVKFGEHGRSLGWRIRIESHQPMDRNQQRR